MVISSDAQAKNSRNRDSTNRRRLCLCSQEDRMAGMKTGEFSLLSPSSRLQILRFNLPHVPVHSLFIVLALVWLTWSTDTFAQTPQQSPSVYPVQEGFVD